VVGSVKLGISTWSLLHLEISTAVKTIGDAGFDYLELWEEVPHAYPEWTDKKQLKDALSTYNFVLTVHAPFTDLNPATPFEPVRGAIEKTLKDFVRFVGDLGASVVTFHPGSVHNQAMIPQSIESSVAIMRALVKEADGTLTVSIENQSRGRSKYHYPLGSSVESMASLLSQVDGAKFTLDTGHGHASEAEPLDLCRRFADRLREVHLSDNGGESDDHLIPGKGTANLKGVLSAVPDVDMLVCLELDPHRYSAEEVMNAAVAFKNSVS